MDGGRLISRGHPTAGKGAGGPSGAASGSHTRVVRHRCSFAPHLRQIVAPGTAGIGAPQPGHGTVPGGVSGSSLMPPSRRRR